MRTLSFILCLAAFAFVNAMSYSTTFGGGNENPISENGAWFNNASVGSFWWQNVKILNGVAHGADIGQTSDFQDAAAMLSGTWGPDQTVVTKFYKSSTPAGSSYAEVEIRLRTTMSADQNMGYECLFSLNGYTNIVRWNRRNSSDPRWANFTILAGGGYNLVNGDELKASVIGNTITMYQNGTKILQTTDNAITSGSPGIGFDASNNGTNSRQSVYDAFGVDSYSASDNGSPTQTFTSIAVSPSGATVITGSTRQFTATALDQIGSAMSPQPVFTWTVSGGGTINSSGLFTAGSTAGGPYTVTASSGGKNGTASVTVAATLPGTCIIRAQNSAPGGTMRLRIADVEVAEWTVGTTAEDFVKSGLSGTSNVKVCFDDNAGDLTVDYISINGTTVKQGEDQAINTGVWNGACVTGSNNAVIGCRGCIDFGACDFGGATVSNPQTGAAPAARSYWVKSLSSGSITVGSSCPGTVRGTVCKGNGAFVASFEATTGRDAAIAVAQPGLYLVRFNGQDGGLVRRVFVN